MQADFSEFSYGYASIHEAEAHLSRIFKQAGAPKLPSLIEEKDLGWDVRLSYVEFAVFLQFKRSDWVSRRHPDSPTWAAMNGKHYRFSIDTDGHQHRALVELQDELASNADSAEVFYVAPLFHTQADFDSNYSGGRVLAQSLLIPPRDIGVADGKHHVSSTPNGSVLVLSDPRPAPGATRWERLADRARQSAVRAATGDNQNREPLRLEELERAVSTSVARLERDITIDREADIMGRLHRSAALLGCGVALALVDPGEGRR